MDVAVLFGAVLGAALGSFAALVFDRVRRRESIVSPPSRCPVCGTAIRARDIVPIVSWLSLRGRCRSCKAFIPLHCLLFELAGAIAGAALALEALRR